ncbi:hypothetical protein DM800_15895 [Bacillus sp. AY18-3]|uniref:hypothetical protein n=1 Tax=Bacillus sp. AY18-3 TaxID=2217814 RepID=UPI0011CB22BC|nr:hypothetical protein [Bacillus sp. AY18-3]TXR64170.1 hypothetical protein DM800_15895 [Bacillus sp. AY18-3]
MSIDLRLNDYMHNIKTLRTFVSAIEPVLIKEADENFKKNGSDLLPVLVAMHGQNPDMVDLDEEKKKRIIKKFDLEITDKNKIKFKNHEAAKKFNETFDKVRMMQKQIEMLYENSLMNLVMYFETLISNLIKQHLSEHGDVKKKTLSFEQISQMGSIEEAKEFLLDKEVHDLMYQGFDDWIAYLKRQLKLSMGYLENCNNQIIEILQRRNLIIHNGGKVNNIYLSRVKGKRDQELKIGDRVLVKKEYLDDAIDLIESIGTLILLEYWKKRKADDTKRGYVLGELTYEHMKEDRWGIVKSYSYFLMNDNGLPQGTRLTAKVNYWQSHKWLNEFEMVKNDVMNADFSANSRDYQLCLLALQDKKERFIELLPEVCPNDIPLEAFREWPIFKEMRDLEATKEFIKKQSSKITVMTPEMEKELELTESEIAVGIETLDAEKNMQDKR